jgi:AcrR family transcriptional regulator
MASKRKDFGSVPAGRRPELRADAARNRQRIVAAAKAALAERGVDVPLEEIAQRAEVGIATL